MDQLLSDDSPINKKKERMFLARERKSISKQGLETLKCHIATSKSILQNQKGKVQNNNKILHHHEKSLLAHTPSNLPPEDNEGYREYKLKLVNIEKERFTHLVTQMKYRIMEGSGEAIYEIGVSDDGLPVGLTKSELDETLSNIRNMAKFLKADVTVLCEREIVDGRKIVEVLVRQFSEESYLDVRIVVCGNVDSGKSTLIGVLTTGELDDAKGSARTFIFQHPHEIDTGRTSSVAHQILGFNSKGECTNYDHFGTPSWKEIVENSTKIATLTDSAGHEKYLKTCIRSLVVSKADYAFITIAANSGELNQITREHIGLCLGLKIPIIIVLTKIDIAPPKKIEETMQAIINLLKLPGVRKIPVEVNNDDDVVNVSQSIASNSKICPIFKVSNVTGESINLLRSFINLVPVSKDYSHLITKKAEMSIDRIYQVSGVGGAIIHGVVQQGRISVGDKLQLGPDSNGKFRTVIVKSIQNKRVNVKNVCAGQHASLCLRKEKRENIRRGMVVTERKNPQAIWEFEAEILVLYHQKGIKKNYELVVHTSNCVRQAAKILSIKPIDGNKSLSHPISSGDDETQTIYSTDSSLEERVSDSHDDESTNSDEDKDFILETGQKAICKLRFLHRPEYIKDNTRLILREGRVRGLGTIVRVFSKSESKHS